MEIQRTLLHDYDVSYRPCTQGLHTLHGRQGWLRGRPGAVLGSLGCRAVGVEDEGVQRCCYRAVLPQGEHVLAFVEVLVVQHQQSLRMHPAARNPCHAKDVRHDTPGLNQITS